MPDIDFEDGIYAIANFKNPELVIEAKDGKTFASQFISSESQQWELVKMYDVAYSIRNVATRKYLGMELDDPVKDRYELREVKHVFPWHLKRGTQIQILLPYTQYIVSLDQSPARLNFLQKDQGQAFGKWYLCKDLHLATSRVLRNRFTYHIVTASSGKAMEVNDGQVSACKLEERRNKQKFMAIKTETGWAFQNVATKSFLGVPIGVVDLKGVIPLSTVHHECAWVVLPHHALNWRFKLWIPFTSRALELDGGNGRNGRDIHVSLSGDVELQWWWFKCVDPNFERNRVARQPQPGEPDRLG